ncbi:hypothetical protein [Catenuloplanes indicus]|uniref:Uncharacterized protein n=1 Tax=Catenuloplanes indicus TaxID=137267 RepID=A0AAE3VY13_9ACTN|nr:hypothetical protein [Catenuloplanes indicus]MDQ0365080.1 hypothetical protein [Catenuloplanes indicus]
MNIAIAISAFSVALSAASLGWQAATYLLTGGRIRVTLELGAVGNAGLVSAPPKLVTFRTMWSVREQGFDQPVVVVKVANIGRQPVTVQRWSLRNGSGLSATVDGATLILQQEIRSELGDWCGFVRVRQAATVEAQRLCGLLRTRRWLPPTE